MGCSLYRRFRRNRQSLPGLSSAGPHAELLYDYVALMLRLIFRFLGEEPIIAFNEIPASDFLFSQTMTGSIDLTTYLAMNEPVLLEMARRYSGEELSEIDDLAIDSIGEFLNETNGIFTVNMSEQNIELNLLPQEIHKAVDFAGNNTYRIPLGTSCGTFDVYIALSNAGRK